MYSCLEPSSTTIYAFENGTGVFCYIFRYSFFIPSLVCRCMSQKSTVSAPLSISSIYWILQCRLTGVVAGHGFSNTGPCRLAHSDLIRTVPSMRDGHWPGVSGGTRIQATHVAVENSTTKPLAHRGVVSIIYMNHSVSKTVCKKDST